MPEARVSSRPPSVPGSALVTMAFAVSAVCFSACSCKENATATRACAKAAGHTACKACCGMHGSTVTSYVSRCTCY